MEIVKLEEQPQMLKEFKIDLIVWKFVNPFKELCADTMFKIDLIVWK